jgi:hypothetical protein
MGAWLYQQLATAEAAIVVGIIFLGLYSAFGGRNADHSINTFKAVSGGISAMAGYTCLILVFSQFFMDIPLSDVIRDQFTDGRLGYVLLVFMFEWVVRLINDFWGHRRAGRPPNGV